MSDTSENSVTPSQQIPSSVPQLEPDVSSVVRGPEGDNFQNPPRLESIPTVIIPPDNRIPVWFWPLFILVLSVFGFMTFKLYGRIYSKSSSLPVPNQKNQVLPTQKPVPPSTVSSNEQKPLSASDDVSAIETDIINTEGNSLNEMIGKLDGEVNATN